ncbi:hypothetical protein [Pseudomonas kulmbachensis]|uniref:Uncharacterized protein n=1 Tax=Pseudomonas kulmbachensis TaxID=3043408 RepID=A0ABW7M252_9PSED
MNLSPESCISSQAKRPQAQKKVCDLSGFSSALTITPQYPDKKNPIRRKGRSGTSTQESAKGGSMREPHA